MDTSFRSDKNGELKEIARNLYKESDENNPLRIEPADLFRKRMVAQPAGPRRANGLPPVATVGMMSMVRRSNGLLEWTPNAHVETCIPSLKRAGIAGLPAGDIIEQYRFSQIAPNQVQSLLEFIDRKVTPFGFGGKDDQRLREWKNGQLVPFDRSCLAGKRVLLVINGTISNCAHLFEEILATPNKKGPEFLAAATTKYDHVLSFDNPTLSVSPVMNAFDLASLLRPAPDSVDLIAHSRGGLVARWFLEGFASPPLRGRAMLVGTTISGTSLAAPERQKAVFNYLANVGEAIGGLLQIGANPFLWVTGQLMCGLSSLTKVGTKTPLLDGAMMMIPGLQGQSRVGNNPELLRLRSNTGGRGIDYFAVTSDFEPTDPGWNFLKYFNQTSLRLADAGADLLFDGPNDLVVDTPYMTELSDDLKIPDDRIHSFGTSPTVHHTNYFRQEATLKFIREKFEF